MALLPETVAAAGQEKPGLRRLAAQFTCTLLALALVLGTGLLLPRGDATRPAHEPFALGLAWLLLLPFARQLFTQAMSIATSQWRRRARLAELASFTLLASLARVPVGWLVAVLLANLCLGWWLAPRLAHRLPAWLDVALPTRPGARWLLLFALGLGTVQWARLTTFMAAPHLTAASIYHLPGRSAPRRGVYSTVTTYLLAGRVNRDARSANVYASALYPTSDKDAGPAQLENRRMGFATDGGFIYPPPFLLLPRGLLALSADVLVLRFLWFVLEAFTLLFGYACLVYQLGPAARRAALAAAPCFLFSFTTLVALEVGNFHVMLLPLTLIGALYVERGRSRWGGSLLALATLTKLYPAVALAAAALWRRGQALASALAASVALLLASLWLSGLAPFVDFVRYTLPRLRSREAFGYLRDPQQLPGNFAAEAALAKLRVICGVPLDDAMQRTCGDCLSVGLLLLAGYGLWRGRAHPHERALLLLSALNLVVVTVPWAPGYVELGYLLLACVLAPERQPALWSWGRWPLLALLSCPDLPMLPLKARCLYTLGAQCLGMWLCAWCLLSSGRRVSPKLSGVASRPGSSRADFSQPADARFL